MSSHPGKRITIVLLGTQDQRWSRCTIGDNILREPNIFPRDSSTCELRENESYSVINTPDFLNEDNNPDQQMVDLMALSGDGPNLIILVLGRDPDMKAKARSLKRQIIEFFGDRIQDYLIVMKPSIDYVECIDTRANDQTQNQWIAYDDLPEKVRTFCRSKPFDYAVYTANLVGRRKQTLDKRREQSVYRNRTPLPPPAAWGSATAVYGASQSDEYNIYEEVHEEEAVYEVPSDMMSNGGRIPQKYLPPSTTKFCIILLGQTGTGKSCTGNTLMGSAGFLSKASSMPVTQICKEITTELFGTEVTIIDTPDFFDESVEKREEQIAKCKQYCRLEPCVFLLVCRTRRFTESEGDVLDRHEKVLEMSLRDRTIVVLTHGEELKRQTMQEFIRDDKLLRQVVKLCEGRCCLINNNSRDRKQVRKLLQLIPGHMSIFPKLDKKITRDLRKVKSESENCVPS